MSTKKFIFSICLTLTLVLSACSSLPAQISSATAQSTGTSKPAIESKLGVGLLSLQGTAQAVTAEQASTLLPLWKALQSLSKDSNTSNAEITALYQQINETLTSEQIQAIGLVKVSDYELTALKTQYGIKSPSAAAGSSKTASTTSTEAPPQGSMDANAMTGGAMPAGTGGDMGGSDISMTSGQTGATQSKTEPSSSSYASRNASDLNLVFASTVVTMLQEIAAV
jgi:hypothetical protein